MCARARVQCVNSACLQCVCSVHAARVWRTVDDVLQRGALVGERLELGRVELLSPVALVHLIDR